MSVERAHSMPDEREWTATCENYVWHAKPNEAVGYEKQAPPITLVPKSTREAAEAERDEAQFLAAVRGTERDRHRREKMAAEAELERFKRDDIRRESENADLRAERDEAKAVIARFEPVLERDPRYLAMKAKAEAAESEVERLKRVIEAERSSAEDETERAIEAVRERDKARAGRREAEGKFGQVACDRERLREALKGVGEQACREWVEGKANYCFEPAEFVLWGKLLKPEALGPRCYDHAAKHVGHQALYPGANLAAIDLRKARAALSPREAD